MKGLDSQDRASDRQIVLAGDQRRGAEVGAGADTLQNGRERDEARPDKEVSTMIRVVHWQCLHVSVGEVVSTGLHRGNTSLLKGAGEELNVRLLVVRDVL